MLDEGLVVHDTVKDLRLGCLLALNSTIDNVNSGTEIWSDSSLFVSFSWFKETSHSVMHTWLWVLWSHIEP